MCTETALKAACRYLFRLGAYNNTIPTVSVRRSRIINLTYIYIRIGVIICIDLANYKVIFPFKSRLRKIMYTASPPPPPSMFFIVVYVARLIQLGSLARDARARARPVDRLRRGGDVLETPKLYSETTAAVRVTILYYYHYYYYYYYYY